MSFQYRSRSGPGLFFNLGPVLIRPQPNLFLNPARIFNHGHFKTNGIPIKSRSRPGPDVIWNLNPNTVLIPTWDAGSESRLGIPIPLQNTGSSKAHTYILEVRKPEHQIESSPVFLLSDFLYLEMLSTLLPLFIFLLNNSDVWFFYT